MPIGEGRACNGCSPIGMLAVAVAELTGVDCGSGGNPGYERPRGVAGRASGAAALDEDPAVSADALALLAPASVSVMAVSVVVCSADIAGDAFAASVVLLAAGGAGAAAAAVREADREARVLITEGRLESTALGVSSIFTALASLMTRMYAGGDDLN